MRRAHVRNISRSTYFATPRPRVRDRDTFASARTAQASPAQRELMIRYIKRKSAAERGMGDALKLQSARHAWRRESGDSDLRVADDDNEVVAARSLASLGIDRRAAMVLDERYAAIVERGLQRGFSSSPR